ncbi:ATP-dependent nuclease [Mucilaginibacter pallidiroseus]|uniref:ATP-dependent nuclease n=1 Tax=Mucilaginibacter pallidiroseus TaxID=2599295 RepID=UPI0016497176|nr:AAA family ATPase [Mucilaginibacter pallidiroseus]
MSAIITSTTKEGKEKPKLELWPKTLWDFLERRLHSFFHVSAYVLDEVKLLDPISGVAQSQKLLPNAVPVEGDPFKGLIKVDIINAQRGFNDPNSEKSTEPVGHGNLSSQLREYYSKHLNPYETPAAADIEALVALEAAKAAFDSKLTSSFEIPLKELADLNYPGFGGNPTIKLTTKLEAIDGLNHKSAVQFELLKLEGESASYPLSLPEKYNGLGYQNLISMVFKLIRFRDEWMQVGKSAKPSANEEPEFEPLHLVLVEEPEAHLHAQVQQVFIKKAYDVLRKNAYLEKYSHFKSQLVVSTHSNHIAHEIDFTALRYFKRKPAAEGEVPTSTIVNLSETFGKKDDTTKFAKRYLRSNHADLFFADAVILVEGSAERMLVPHFLRHAHKDLYSCYIAILEIGGRHGHTLRPLLEQLGIITLIITDLDSVDPTKRNSSVYPVPGKGYNSGNTVLRTWLPAKKGLDELIKVAAAGKIANDFPFRVAYQTGIQCQFPGDEKPVTAIPYTFEVALALENKVTFSTFKDPQDMMADFQEALKLSTTDVVNRALYDALKSKKKAEFALDVLYLHDPTTLIVPEYIKEGLNWLSEQLNARPKEAK